MLPPDVAKWHECWKHHATVMDNKNLGSGPTSMFHFRFNTPCVHSLPAVSSLLCAAMAMRKADLLVTIFPVIIVATTAAQNITSPPPPRPPPLPSHPLAPQQLRAATPQLALVAPFAVAGLTTW